MRHLLAPVVMLGALVAGPRTVAADRLVIYGPPGTGTDRRALAVIAGEDGACAPWSGVTAAVDEAGAAVSLEEPAGDCARWVRIHADPPREQVTLRLRPGAGAEAVAAVAMGSDQGLELRSTRSDTHLRVRVAGAPEGDPVRVTAVWSDGQADLSAAGSDFVGTVPADALVGIVARSGSLVGADALPATVGTARGPEVLALPSALAVPAGAAVRTAAFLFVADGRGRLSSSVPLRVVSGRGRLRSLTWIRSGVAAVGLSAAPGTPSVDLSTWTVSEASRRTLEIPVEADWPARARVDAPGTVLRGDSVTVRVSATTLAGLEVTADRLRVTCGPSAARREPEGHFVCTAPAAGPEIALVVGAIVDDREVPLAHRLLAIHEPPPPPSPPPPPPRRRASPPAPPAPRSRLAPAALALVGVDSSGEAAWGAGVRAELAMGPHAFLTAATRYTGASIDVAPEGLVTDPLVGTRHGAEIQAGGGLSVRVGRMLVATSATIGPSWLFTDATVGGSDDRSAALRLIGQASAGPRGRLGAIALGVDLGVRLVAWSTERTWREPVATAFLEVSGGASND